MEKEITLTETEMQAVSCLVRMICQYITKSDGYSWTLQEIRMRIETSYGLPSNRSKMGISKTIVTNIENVGFVRPKCTYSVTKNPNGINYQQIDGIKYSFIRQQEKTEKSTTPCGTNGTG